MIEIDLRNLPKIMNKKFFSLLTDQHPLEVLVGSANSGKSYGAAQKVVFDLISKKGIRYIVARKVKKDVRHSCYDLLKFVIINQLGMANLFYFNETEMLIRCLLNNNDAICCGLDDVDKLKSIMDPTNFWVEEADQCLPQDVQQLRIRLRPRAGNKSVQQGILTLNPVWVGHWIKKELVDKPSPDVLFHHSTYRDNRFLNKQTIHTLESITDPYYKAVYVEGEWGVYGNVVFHNYVIEDFDYGEDDLENVFNGVDYGFVHASVFSRGGFRDDEIYVFDEVAGKQWTNADFIDACEEHFGEDAKDWYIRAESAEPDRIEEWNRRGYYNLEGAKKGKGSLSYGIDYLTSKRIHIHKSNCPKLAAEVQQFKRKEDKNGEVLPGFVEINDDAIAALRYGTEPIWANDNNPSYDDGYSLDDLGL
jgi:phage terminase large subunit